jgi:hypothetical protein
VCVCVLCVVCLCVFVRERFCRKVLVLEVCATKPDFTHAHMHVHTCTSYADTHLNIHQLMHLGLCAMPIYSLLLTALFLSLTHHSHAHRHRHTHITTTTTTTTTTTSATCPVRHAHLFIAESVLEIFLTRHTHRHTLAPLASCPVCYAHLLIAESAL